MEQSALDHQVQPELRLVRLFFHDPHLRDELLARPSAARRSIVGPNRRASPQQLLPEDLSSPASWQLLDQTDDSQSECSSSSHQLVTRHELTLSIRNPQSEIRNYRFLPRTSAQISHTCNA